MNADTDAERARAEQHGRCEFLAFELLRSHVEAAVELDAFVRRQAVEYMRRRFAAAERDPCAFTPWSRDVALIEALELEGVDALERRQHYLRRVEELAGDG